MVEEQTQVDGQQKIVVQDTIELVEGIHKGTISKVEFTTNEGFNYMKIHVDTIDSKGSSVTINTDFAWYLSKNSALYRFMNKAGVTMAVGQEFNLKTLSDAIGGKEIQFETIKDGSFHNIKNESILFVQK